MATEFTVWRRWERSSRRWSGALIGASLLICAILAAPPNVTVTTSSGGEVQGGWKGIVGDDIAIQTSQGLQKLAITDVLAVRSSQKATVRRDNASRLELLDGSQILASEIVTSAEKDKVEVVPLGSKERITVPLKAFRWIRFGASTGEVAAQWDRLVEGETPSDLIVIRRKSGALDQASGIVLELEKERVRFDLDGQVVEPARTQLEGLIFKTVANGNVRTAYEIADSFGGLYRANKIRGIGDDTIEFETPSGLRRQIPLSAVERLSAEGNVIFLASQEPAGVNYSPEFNIPVKKALLEAWLGPGKVSEQTLRLVAPCRMEFRIPEGFQRFQGTLEPDPAVAAGGGCELVISADGEELQRHEMKIDSAPVRLSFELGKKRRIIFELRAGAGGAYGDWLLLKEARFLP